MISYLKDSIGVNMMMYLVSVGDKIISKMDPNKTRRPTFRKIKTAKHVFYVDAGDFEKCIYYKKRRLGITWKNISYRDMGSSHTFNVIFDVSTNEKIVGTMLEKYLKMKAFW
jgi:hypothetical protein